MAKELWRQPLGANPLIRILKQRRLEATMAKQTARIAIETGGELPSTSKSKLPGDPAALRGIPVTGHGGAMRGTNPETELLRKQERLERGAIHPPDRG